MAKFKLFHNRDRFRRQHQHHHLHNRAGSNLTNYAAFLIATIFVVFTACAKSAHLSVNTLALATATEQRAAETNVPTATSAPSLLELDESEYAKSSLYASLASAFVAAASSSSSHSLRVYPEQQRQHSADVVAEATLPQTSASPLNEFIIETTTATANTRNALNTATNSKTFPMPQKASATKEYFSIDSNIEYNIRQAAEDRSVEEQHEQPAHLQQRQHKHHHHHHHKHHSKHHHHQHQHQQQPEEQQQQQLKQHHDIYQQQYPYHKKHHHHKHHHNNKQQQQHYYQQQQHQQQHEHEQHHNEQLSNTNDVDEVRQAAINTVDQDKLQQHQQQQSTMPEQQQLDNIFNHELLSSNRQQLPIELATSLPASASLLLTITTPEYTAESEETTTRTTRTTTTPATPYTAAAAAEAYNNATAGMNGYTLVPLHRYRSKYSIEDLLNNQFELKITNDIDMDPCKASGFMGDIALTDIDSENDNNDLDDNDDDDDDDDDDDSSAPIVAFTRLWQDEPQADAPMSAAETPTTKYNDTFQKEMEILKQEVYHEGLQVEEEGLTDIIRRKTKLPSIKPELNGNTRSDNEQSTNESLKKPLNLNTYQQPQAAAHYLNENHKNEVISSEERSPEMKKYTLIEDNRQLITDNQQFSKSKLETNSNISEEEEAEHLKALDFDRKKSYQTAEQEKYNKSSMVFINRNVDQRKIQSNTKDIELDAGNNFISERRVIVPTSLPQQRSTLPNVFSNAGGNGMKLDEIDEVKVIGGAVSGMGSVAGGGSAGSVTVKRRNRRGRKNRRSSYAHHRAEYNKKLQELKAELSRPYEIVNKLNKEHINYQQHQHQQHQQQQKQHQQHYTAKHHEHQLTQHNVTKSPVDSEELKYSKLSKDFSNEDEDDIDTMPKMIPAYEAPVNDDFSFVREHRRLPRAVTAKKERVWDFGIIPYEIDGNFSGLHKALFKQAMRHWENSTCIKFVEREPENHPNYIVFTIRGCGCCSFVGKRGNGPQAISIGRNCDKFGIVVHELGHVVGFWHEHTRPDREKHVIIEHNNIMKGQDYNFNKLTPDEVDSLGMAYDYDSIMHYARNTFSKGTYLDTILPIEVRGKKRPEIGQRLRLSAGDVAQANLLYKCPKCGRTFQENTGIFASPSYYTAGALTNDTEHCEWRITATHGERVVLKLENLNIFKSENCQTDYLEIRDGYWHKSPLIARFCGKVQTEMLTTVSSRMLLTYVNMHRAEGFRGFKAEFDVVCGGELSIDDNEGRLESPNYPLDYLPNKECVWKIAVPKGYQVALKFQSFEVENHDSCVYDFVEVRDGPDEESPLIGVFCGYKPPPNMKSTGDTMYVKFASDTSVQKPGFSATFMKEVDECETQNHGCEHECINTLGGYECSCHIGYELHSDKKHCEDACGGVIEYPNGTITSPSFPDTYPQLKDCIWEIIAPPKHKISLNFTHFDLEGAIHHQSECSYDKVTIYSKLSESRLKKIGTYCGNSIPPTATSEGNALRVEFHSDRSIEKSGFAAVFFTDIDECSINNGGCQHECINTIGSYLCSCHNGYSLHENGHDCKEGECKHEISAPFGTIYSPNYPDKYPPNADCVWHFSTTPGHRIKLIFNEFQIESHQECTYDNVAIYDGDSENSSMLGRFCGDKIPYPISSSTNQLYMVLKTDINKQLTGFQAMHSTACGGYLSATDQMKQFYSHSRFGNQNYDINMDCEWTIQAPPGLSVHLSFLTFDLEMSENCTYDYVQVYSGMEDTSGPMYGQYCGNTNPQDIISLTDSLLIRFKTDSTNIRKGFSASYIAAHPYENSEDELTSLSSEMITPFPGSLKSIYKEAESEETDDYNDFNENQLGLNSPYYSRNRYQNRY